MTFNPFYAAAFSLTLTIVPVRAETINLSQSSTAQIQGHDTFSRFMADAFLPVPANWTDGSKTPDKPSDQIPVTSEILPAAEPNAPMFQKTPAIPFENVQTIQASDQTFKSGNDLGPIGGDPAPGLSTVPLPASFPMFGAALVALGAFGYGVRRRKAAGRA